MQQREGGERGDHRLQVAEDRHHAALHPREREHVQPVRPHRGKQHDEGEHAPGARVQLPDLAPERHDPPRQDSQRPEAEHPGDHGERVVAAQQPARDHQVDAVRRHVQHRQQVPQRAPRPRAGAHQPHRPGRRHRDPHPLHPRRRLLPRQDGDQQGDGRARRHHGLRRGGGGQRERGDVEQLVQHHPEHRVDRQQPVVAPAPDPLAHQRAVQHHEDEARAGHAHQRQRGAGQLAQRELHRHRQRAEEELHEQQGGVDGEHRPRGAGCGGAGRLGAGADGAFSGSGAGMIGPRRRARNPAVARGTGRVSCSPRVGKRDGAGEPQRREER